MRKKSLGNLGENLALKKLKNSGYRIIDRNFHTKFGEIDIIAQDDQALVFLEVKARRSRDFGRPDEAISSRKIRHMTKAAQSYKLLHPELPDSLRLDAVLIDFSEDQANKKIKIIKNLTR
jgi:putative endonuclease